MDFEFHQRTDLAKKFISAYIQKSRDQSMIKLLYFMMCFKACVRAKVSFFRAQEVDKKQGRKTTYQEEAKKHLILAKKYIKLF